MEPSTDLVAYSYKQGKRVLEKKSLEILKEHGQFLTHSTVAQYIAKQIEEFPMI